MAKISSPDGKNSVTVSFDGTLRYEIHRNGDLILAPSPLTMKVDGEVWGTDARARKVTYRNVDENVNFTVARKAPVMRNAYSEAVLRYRDYNVEFRAYDDGVAYRFVGTSKAAGKVEQEVVRYNFADDYQSYTLLTKNLQNWFEENYTEKKLSELPGDMVSMTPLMVEVGKYDVLLAEANLYNYPGMYLRASGLGFDGVLPEYPAREEFAEGTNKIYVVERENWLVDCNLNRSFPWRVTGIFDNDIDMVGSELIYMLSDKTTEDYSWIRPGKILWDWWNHNNIYNVDFQAGINTPTYMYMIDFAAEHGIEYVLFDEGWSGRDDLLVLNPDVDMPAICKYAQEKGVGVMLWAKWGNVDRQLDEAFDLMASWGVKGVKIDFMDRNDAKLVNFYERVAKKATECRFLIDFHGSYPNEGMRAKYPNLITREGVVGLEYNKMTDKCNTHHDLIIPYLRMWAGPMDYTPGAMWNAQMNTYRVNHVEPMSHGTRCHQLAMYVVYESPAQMLSDSPTKYAENPCCLEFLKHVPTVWDETLPLSGEIGSNIVVARRSGDKWYVGAMCDEPQEVVVDLSFLDKGEYEMTAYRDGYNAERNGRDHLRETSCVKAGDRLTVKMATGGGFAAVISKK